MLLTTILEEHQQFPLTMQIAAKFILADWTEITLQRYLQSPELRDIQIGYRTDIHNYFRDFDRGFRIISGRLWDLVKGLDLEMPDSADYY